VLIPAAAVIRVVWALVVLAALAGSARSQAPEPGRAFEVTRYAPETRPPGFQGRTVTGQPVSLADLKGRVVLLNFWAAWCLECRSEMPELERVHHELGPHGLSVVGVNSREGAATVRAYADALGLTFPLALDSDGAIGRAYGVIGLPTSFLIGRDGRAVALAVGPRAWDGPRAREILRDLLAEPAPGAR
jgi:peroxiredoxin